MYIIADAIMTPTRVMITATTQRYLYLAEGPVREEDDQTYLGNRGDMSERCPGNNPASPSSFFNFGGLI